jgi:hypothetical protein
MKLNPLKTKRISAIQGLSPYRALNTLHLGYKNKLLMSYKATVAVCSDNIDGL